jgi:glutathione synthase/RimK-type ligase-like ATP-grasp enzyme
LEKIRPKILIISNKHDYSTDYVTFQLNRKNATYLRLNRDQFTEFKINLIPSEQKLFGETKEFAFEISPKILESIYFRAPIYLRDNYQPNLSPSEQLSRSQWTAFMRALMIFDNVLWVNHPQATYKAEVKPYQLYLAKKIGFNIPKTTISNSVSYNKTDISRNKK